MSGPRKSYTKVAYELRPAKQIERRIIIEALQKLSQSGFRIEDYKYTGMGSIFFTDYIVFHKFLGIKNMVSVERDKTSRVDFNRPFGEEILKIEDGLIGDHIVKLNKDKKHLLWLDYDYPIVE